MPYLPTNTRDMAFKGAISDARRFPQVKCCEVFLNVRYQVFCIATFTVGVLLGFYLKDLNLSESQLQYIRMPGDVLMNVLRMAGIPLLVTSVISGAAKLSAKASKKVTAQTLVYIVVSTMLAVVLGLILAVSIKPGVPYAHDSIPWEKEHLSAVVIIKDLLRNLVPDNMLLAFFRQFQTEFKEVPVEDDAVNGTEWLLVDSYVDQPNTLALILWSVILGLFLEHTGDLGNQTVEALSAANEGIQTLVSYIIPYLPLTVICMVASQVMEVDDMVSFSELGMFAGVVCLGLVIHAGVVLPLIYFLFTRRNPFAVVKAASPALMTALCISSSSATLPHTLKCCENKMMIDKKIVNFVLPIFTNVNMNGTCMYEVVAAVFIAQLNSISLEFGQIITICVTAAISSLGATAMPAAGAVTTIFVLSVAGLPLNDAPLLLAGEWILDRLNTVVNVLGDCFGVALIHHLTERDLQNQDRYRARYRSKNGGTNMAASMYVHLQQVDINDSF